MQPKPWHRLFITLFLLATLSTQAKAAATASNSTSSQNQENMRKNYAIRIQDEMHCYALPYGAIGTVSHILTFYSSWCWAAGRAPLRPWTFLHMVKLDAALFVVAFLITFSLSIATLVRCQGTTELQCVAVWKLFLGVTAFALEMFGTFWQSPMGARGDNNKGAEEEDGAEEYNMYGKMQQQQCRYPSVMTKWTSTVVGVWTVFMIPYMISAMVGLGGLSAAVFRFDEATDDYEDIWTEDWPLPKPLPRNPVPVTILMLVFMGLVIMAFVWSIAILEGGMVNHIAWRAVKVLTMIMIAASAIFSDWALAFLADDIVGQGEGKTAQALSWVYFFAKRLPMLGF